MNRVFVVSDGTGKTAEQVLQAALTQFSGADVAVERRSHVRTAREVEDVVDEARRADGFIVHTLVSDDLRDEMFRQGRLQDVETIDLMGPLLARLSQQLSLSPSEKPGLFRELNEEYFRRIESMEFAFRHDDGQRIQELDRAEIVLVGVSRTFKTPLSIYLAFRSWFVANVPVVLGLRPPPQFSSLEGEKAFGLTMSPEELARLRQARAQRLGGATGEYAELDYVRKELKYALDLFHKHGWSVIDVTGKPIETIASEILALVRESEHSPD